METTNTQRDYDIAALLIEIEYAIPKLRKLLNEREQYHYDTVKALNSRIRVIEVARDIVQAELEQLREQVEME